MEISNPDKVMFPGPGFTKADLVGYYAEAAERMLPWLDGRPLTLERYPNGVGEKGFYQKHASSHFSERIERVEVPKSDGTVVHAVVRDAEGLVELANQGTITFHVWTAAAPDLDRPTHVVLDLDPEQGDVSSVRSVAGAVGDLLNEFDLVGRPVVSGKKGFHVWVPVADLDYEAAAATARALAGLTAVRYPDLATVEFLKKNREGRVFVDWLRNRRAQSIVSPWSVRTTDHASVALPVDWDEISEVRPDEWSIDSALDRPSFEPPANGSVDVDRIVSAARDEGVDMDSDFDRFGR
ncbi:MAG: non-homologous end-joining DNA ligase [Acidimicrobiia bacterium]|nr:non-homologous end-joining DNA ligase [Acidimicrobiia bacterium]